MRLIEWLLAAALGAAALFLLAWPVPIQPVAYKIGKNPGKTGAYAANERLSSLILIPVGGTGPADSGPEDIARGPDGMLYTGLASGKIVRINPASSTHEDFADTGGRPLGLAFDAAGNLIVADARKGLLSVAPDGTVSLLTDEVNAAPFAFLNDVAVGADGRIWFTESTRRHDVTGVFIDLLEAQATGQLLCYDPATKTTSVALDKLSFANGLTMGPDDAYILVDESRASRITRYWLTGEQAGKSDVFIENLPGLPDNISYDAAAQRFWVALVLPRTDLEDQLASRPNVRKILLRLSELPWDIFALPAAPSNGAWVIGLDLNGKVVANLQSSSGKFAPVTSAHDFGDGLYLGSVIMTSIARYAPATP